MKKLSLCIVSVCLVSFSTQAQQGMGVGNNNPLEMLHVTGAIKVGTDINNNTGAPSGGAGTFRFKSGQFEGWDGSSWSQFGGDTDWTLSGNNQYSAVSGNVGVGVTNPTYKLDVASNARIGNAKIGIWPGNSVYTYFAHESVNASVSYALVQRNTGATFLNSSAGNNITFQINNSDKAVLSADGNLGIGTTTPVSKLEVAGQLKITGGTPGTDKVLRSDNTGLATWVDPNTLIANDGDWTISGNNQYSAVSGNVGIGTTTPGRQLNVESATGGQIMLSRADGSTTDGEMMGEILFDNTSNTAVSSVDAAAVIRGVATGTQGNSNKRGYLSFFTKNNVPNSTGATERMRIAADGIVGILNSSSLKFYDDGGTTIRGTIGQYATNSDMVMASNVNNAWLRIGANNSNIAFMPDNTYASGSNPAVVISANKRMGIGTTVPIAPLHVESQTTSGNEASYGNFWFYSGSGTSGGACCGGSVTGVSIHASGRVMASEFDAFSDARIKNILGVTNNQEDLKTLLDIEITDYKMKDGLKGDKPYKKVIAQQVEAVYPQATSTITEVVPDIYEMASMNNGVINLNSDVKVGDKVKLIFEDGNEMVEVVSSSEGSFTVNSDKSGDVFVYGREVNDFHVVDYEAISMLNVSATQELFKLVQQLQNENKILSSKLKDFASMKSDIELLKEAAGIDAHTSN